MPNGKALYLHMEAVYPKYQMDVIGKEVLALVDLKFYLQNASSFIRYQSTCFRWEEPMSEKVNMKYTVNIAAPMFCYDTLKEKYNIDFERYSIEEFETAILAKGIPVEDIEEIKLKGKFVCQVIGYVNNQKCKWNAEGKCFIKIILRAPNII